MRKELDVARPNEFRFATQCLERGFLALGQQRLAGLDAAEFLHGALIPFACLRRQPRPHRGQFGLLVVESQADELFTRRQLFKEAVAVVLRHGLADHRAQVGRGAFGQRATPLHKTIRI
ncbi:MAG: hypothetical protein NTW87_07035 [Planctomycetota bacterium]|nr:hypothetical protein [Planctomycetota bacterium]